jgi:hypothetical protein
LHIPPGIDDHTGDNLLANHTVDHPVGLEEGLSVLADTQYQQFLPAGTALRKCAQTQSATNLVPKGANVA